jgi:hypothetical protein
MRKRSWTIAQLEEAVKQASSYRQVLFRLGLRQAGGNYEQIRKYIKEYNLDTSHFIISAWNKGLHYSGQPQIPLNEVLVARSSFQSFKLKKRLFNANLKPRHCEECGWARVSDDGYLPLELDHINGDRHDNRIENLRVLCPNCHSLKPTHRGKNRRRIARVAK